MRQLFNDGSLQDKLHRRIGEAKNLVERTPAQEIREDAPGVADRIIKSLRLRPLSVDTSKPTTKSFEAKIAVRDDFTRERFTVDGVGVRATVPFTGSEDLLYHKPSTSLVSGVPEADVARDSISVQVTDRALAPETAREAIRGQLKKIEQYAEWANADVQAWLPQFEAAVRSAVSDRAARLQEAGDLDDLFG